MPGTPFHIRGDSAAVLNTKVIDAKELAYDATAKRLRLGDGATLGGIPMARLDELPTPQVGHLNRLRNAEFRIDQRRNGGPVTVSTAGVATLDGWVAGATGGGAFSVQRQAIADLTGLDEPFPTSAKLTVTAADASIAAGDFYSFSQRLLGVDVADLGWGTSSARSVTVALRLRASLPGAYNLSVRNYGGTRSYVFQVMLPAAGAWTKCTVTVPGDTSGAWVTDLNPSIMLTLDLGSGTALQCATVNAWLPGNYVRADSGASLIATLGATLEITGVELKPGAIITAFPRLAFADELRRCQAYYQKSYDLPIGPGNAVMAGMEVAYPGSAATAPWLKVPFRSTMWSPPVVTLYSPATGASGVVRNNGAGMDVTADVVNVGTEGFHAQWAQAAAGQGHRFHWVADREVI